ncbi:SCP2 sterol-binding domain-containing protein [Streptomyces sp. CA-250714]|uniref:SCP2 sterol-binding domain-containing protein n=1 Tax=Streptomyces sp. CA-250714 TaxID=3240060 RepID=UPI003D8CEBC3
MTAREAMFHQLRNIVRSRAAATPSPPPDEVEALLDLVFEWFRARFSPERAALASGVFHYEIDTPLGVRHRYVAVAQGACTTSSTPESTLGGALDGAPDATIGVALPDLVALAVGELKGTDAFVGGRLKISGDVFFAMNWIEWFGARSGHPPGPGADAV